MEFVELSTVRFKRVNTADDAVEMFHVLIVVVQLISCKHNNTCSYNNDSRCHNNYTSGNYDDTSGYHNHTGSNNHDAR